MPETIQPPPMPGKKKQLSTIDKVKRWGGLVGAIAGLLGAGGTVWKTITYIDELHDTIGANKTALEQMRNQLDEDHDSLEDRIGTVAGAIRAQRDHDREVITNLRIAVAALQAAQDVRAGRVTYGGVQGDRLALAEAPRPPSARVRREQAERAEEDAQTAIRRATAAQMTAENDPLAALEGL